MKKKAIRTYEKQDLNLNYYVRVVTEENDVPRVTTYTIKDLLRHKDDLISFVCQLGYPAPAINFLVDNKLSSLSDKAYWIKETKGYKKLTSRGTHNLSDLSISDGYGVSAVLSNSATKFYSNYVAWLAEEDQGNPAVVSYPGLKYYRYDYVSKMMIQVNYQDILSDYYLKDDLDFLADYGTVVKPSFGFLSGFSFNWKMYHKYFRKLRHSYHSILRSTYYDSMTLEDRDAEWYRLFTNYEFPEATDWHLYYGSDYQEVENYLADFPDGVITYPTELVKGHPHQGFTLSDVAKVTSSGKSTSSSDQSLLDGLKMAQVADDSDTSVEQDITVIPVKRDAYEDDFEESLADLSFKMLRDFENESDKVTPKMEYHLNKSYRKTLRVYQDYLCDGWDNPGNSRLKNHLNWKNTNNKRKHQWLHGKPSYRPLLKDLMAKEALETAGTDSQVKTLAGNYYGLEDPDDYGKY